MTVEALKEGMTAREFEEWILFYNREPFGEYRSDLRMALNTANIVSVLAGKGLKVKDFMLEFEQKPNQEKTAGQMIQQLDLYFGLHNEKVKQEGK